LYPAWVSLMQFGLTDRPFRAFVFSGREREVERVVPGMFARVEHMFGSIGVLPRHVADTGGDSAQRRKLPVMHHFEEAVVGSGTNSAKLDMNGNFSLGACRELDACRSFRRKAYLSQGLPVPPPARSAGPFRVIIVGNKRLKLQMLAEALQEMTALGKPLEDFQIRFVDWTKPRPGLHQSMQSGNLIEHLEILSQADIHMSAGGTGQMYQHFLPDGAVHINLGGGHLQNHGENQGFMEEYMAEGAPYLRALYYPRVVTREEREDPITVPGLVGLLEKAKEVLRRGFSGPTPVGANLSPVGKVFKAYCYLRHRQQFGNVFAAPVRATLRDVDGDTMLGNDFPEQFVYSGLPGHQRWRGGVDKCLLGALRASFDRSHPHLGREDRGWFGTGGELE